MVGPEGLAGEPGKPGRPGLPGVGKPGPPVSIKELSGKTENDIHHYWTMSLN